MAINYSLICWGGRTGRNPTSISNASPCVVTFSATHGLYDGMGLVFTTSGSLPTGITAGTTYYARSTGSTTINLYDTQAHAIAGGSTGRVNTSSAGSGTHTATSDLWYNFDTTWGSLYGGVDKTRYGSAGSERVYDGQIAWRTARAAAISSANQYDTEYVEYGTQWTDYYAASTSLTLDLAVVSIQMESKINGYRTDSYSSGALTGGYWARPTSAFYVAYDINRINVRIDGLGVDLPSNDQFGFNLPSGTIPAGSINVEIANCVIKGNTGSYNQTGILHRSEFGAKIHDNIIANLACTSGTRAGIYFRANAGKLGYVYNNIVTGCDRGIYGDGSVDGGYIFNNISTGNTTNWGSQPTGITQAANNAGESASSWTKGSAWYVGTDTRVNVTTSDFTSSTDFTPALTSSPQVDAGVAVYGGQTVDIVGNERPAYNNGSTETWDLGAFEKNLGYTRPQVREITVTTGGVSGMQIVICNTGTQTELFRDNSASTSETYDAGADGVTVDVTVMKAGYLPQRFTGIALENESYTLDATPTIDQNYVASSGLTWGSNLTADTGNKYWKVNAATSLRNLYSALIEAWIAQSALVNKTFPLEMNGPGGMISKDGWESRGYSTAGTGISNSTLDYITDDGLTYQDTSGTVTAQWAAIATQGVPSGKTARYQQADGSGTTNAESTGDVNQLVQIYGDSSHGNFDKRSWMVWKVQAPGYDQAEFDLYSTYGALEGQGYVVPLVPTANGVADASGITGITITDHGASPVTWNGITVSLTIKDTTDTHSGEQILQYFRNSNSFNYHDLVQVNGSAYKTVRGKVYGDSGATIKGVRVVKADGTTAHADFTLFTGDDGSTYEPVIPAAVNAAAQANTRFVLYNVTQDVEIDNAFSSGGGYSYTISTEADIGDTLDLHYFTIGYQEGRTRFTWSGSATTVAIDQTADTIETAIASDLEISDYTTITEFAADVAGHVQIDADDADGVSQKGRLALWYKYILTTEDGARYFRGGISLLAFNSIRINADVVDLTMENVSATYGLRFTDTDRRLWRSDGASLIATASQPGSIENDYNGVPDTVETGVSGLTGEESAQLMALPSAATIATSVWNKTLP